MILLDDIQCRERLFPFTHIRHTADIRLGIFTIREKWERLTGGQAGDFTGTKNPEDVVIPANIIPEKNNFQKILASCLEGREPEGRDILSLNSPWQIFEYNERALRADFELLPINGISADVQSSQLINSENILIEPGAELSHCIINATDGPVYIARNSKVMEGSVIRGPFAMLENSVVKMGAKIYGATTLGPSCIAGGEIKNSVFFGYSNKAHDGYLGDSVIGEWCNIGAGSSNSNIRNNASAATYILSAGSSPVRAGLKAGLLMGDFSRCAINTSFYTASTVGICCNIFGASIPLKYTPHFTWGDSVYEWDKALEDIESWMSLKGRSLTAELTGKLSSLYQTIR